MSLFDDIKNLGRTTREFPVLGMTFTMRTLTGGDSLKALRMLNKNDSDDHKNRLYEHQVLSKSLVSVKKDDKVETFTPDTALALLKGCSELLIDELISCYTLMVEEQRDKCAEEFGELNQTTQAKKIVARQLDLLGVGKDEDSTETSEKQDDVSA